MALSRLSFIKLAELVITITCMVLHYNSAGENVDAHSAMLINGVFVGFTIILVALFAGYLMNTPINKRLDLFFSLVGAAGFIASGIIIINHWNDDSVSAVTEKLGFNRSDRKTLGLAKGGLAIVNGILFLVDVVFTFRD
ncbi:CLUMA_CG017774, isoform A [Clunio marinus]|uniref:CLUMA_CG017774, isoform A n=1 Tax=Clunio marinus TaxID=568069 RepID=A0A1J1IYD6_9DIPT|nr:CLUMA_CG017774, isoform A [Clunio marinus]